MTKEQDASFMRTFALVLGFLVVFTIFIVIVANVVTSGLGEKEANKMAQKAIDERLAPIATVKVAGAAASDDKGGEAAAPKSGKDIVTASCFACHSTGAAGAPKIGDKAAWQARFDAGMDSMMNTALNGKGAMPARGGNPSLTDDDIKAAVISMLEDTGFDVASAPAAPAAAPAPAAPVAAAPAAAEPAPAAADAGKGKEIYIKSCSTCHGMGIAGAPKLGDKAAWSARIAQGDATLVDHAIKGFQGSTGFMPAKGGFAFLSDEDVAAAVGYMVSESK